MAKPKDPFAVELGRRIDDAWARAGFRDRAAMVRASGLPDYNQVARWCRGAAAPSVRHLGIVAQTCSVSLDWLVFGAEGTPPAFVDWLETPIGQQAPDDAKRFLRSLPLHGYQASTAFYDLAFQAWKLGLTRGLTPELAAQLARDTERDS